jgi:hypothetical protein
MMTLFEVVRPTAGRGGGGATGVPGMAGPGPNPVGSYGGPLPVWLQRHLKCSAIATPASLPNYPHANTWPLV